MMDTYTARGNMELEENFGIMTQIIQLEGKAAVIKKSVEEVSVRVEDLKEYTQAQVTILADEISAEVRRATDAEAALTIRADEIEMHVTDFEQETNAQFVILADQISMKVSKGDVTNQVNSELQIAGNYIKFTTGTLIVDATNFQLDRNGNATFSGTVRGANVVSSTISAGAFYADDRVLEMGDYYITADETYQLASQNGLVAIDCHGHKNGRTMGQIELHVDGSSLSAIYAANGFTVPEGKIKGALYVDDEIYMNTNYMAGWGISRTLKWLDDRITDLENRI